MLQIGFAASHVSDLKLVEAGLAKETKALLSVPLIPISILLPIFVSRWTAGRRPLGLYGKAFTVGIIVTGVIGVMVWVTGAVKDLSGNFPGWYFPVLLLVECAYKVKNNFRDSSWSFINFVFSVDMYNNDQCLEHGIQRQNK